VIELVVQKLPELVKAAAEPVGNVDKLTVISTNGASELVRNVANNLEQGLQIGSDLTGVDLRSILQRVGGNAGDQKAT
jgi:flotillin